MIQEISKNKGSPIKMNDWEDKFGEFKLNSHRNVRIT